MATKISDRQTIRWPADSTWVNVDQPDELEYWSMHFRVSAGKLKQAVRTVGPKFKDVAFHLDSRRDGGELT